MLKKYREMVVPEVARRPIERWAVFFLGVRVEGDMGLNWLAEFEERLREQELNELYQYKAGVGEAPILYRASGHLKSKSTKGMVFVASDESPDRRGDTIACSGWQLDNFRLNPVYMYAHDYGQAPVGTVPKVWVEGKQLLNTVKWDTEDPAALFLKGKYDRGIMRAESVGFRPIEFHENMVEGQSELGGIAFTKQELIEISAVPVPMHPLALQKAMATKRLWSLPGNEPEIKGVIGYKKTSKADQGAAWDGPKEVAAASVDDLKVMCAWVDSENPDVKSSYKFPHHKQDGYAVVFKACAAGIGVLNGGRGGADIPDGDKAGVYAHLAKHIKDDFDTEPAPLKTYKEDDVNKAPDPMAEMGKKIDACMSKMDDLMKKLDEDMQSEKAVTSTEPETPDEETTKGIVNSIRSIFK